MHENTIEDDIAFLTEGLVSPVETRIMLRSTLEASLFRMGYDAQEIDAALDAYYATIRTLN